MVRKILDVVACVALLLSASLAGGSFVVYKYVSSPQFEEQVRKKIMKEIKLPGLSGPALPTGPLTPSQQRNEKKKAVGVPFMPITHNKPFPSCRCINEEKQVFGDSFKQVF